MSIIVILCQTLVGRTIAQDTTTLIQRSGKELIADVIEPGQSSDLVEASNEMSDTPGQKQPAVVDISDAELLENQSGTDVIADVESGSVTDVVSNLSDNMIGSGLSDDAGELLTFDAPQPMVGVGVVDQNLLEIAYFSDENISQDEILSSVLTSFALPNPSPQLSITEVRIDGTDEYIELTNWGDPFVGSISISGVRTSGLLTVDLDLGINESVVIGDTLTMVVVSGFDMLSNQGLSLTDTSARSVQLIYSGEVIDFLDLSATQIIGSDNQSASREYDFMQQIWQITPLSHNAHITSGHRGNPGVVRGLTFFPPSTGSTITGDIFTGSTNTGSIGTGIISTGITTTGNNNSGMVKISQVYPFSDCLGEHLELSFASDYSGSLTIVGLGTSDTSKTFNISAQSGSIRYIVESISGILSDNVILVPNITLTDGGESLVVFDGSGMVLDSIVYSSIQPNKVSAFTSYSGDVRIFTTNQSPTILSSCNQSIQLPQIGGCRISATNQGYNTGGFSAGFTVSGSLIDSSCGGSYRLVDGIVSSTNSCSLGSSFAPGSHRIVYQQYSGSTLICEDEYMFFGAIHQQTITNTVTNTIIQTGEQYICGIVAQHTTPFKFGNSINLIASLDGKELQNSSSYTCERSGITFTGSDSCNPPYFTLPQAILASLELTISKDGQQLCQTQSFINYPSASNNSSPSISSSTYYEDLYRKRKEKHDILASNIRKQGCTVNTQDQIGGNCVFDPNIVQQPFKDINTVIGFEKLVRFQQHQNVLIDHIIADPPGRDADGGEMIQLVRDDQDVQSGSGVLLVINNKADRIINNATQSGLIQIIYDSFPLPNDGGCIALTDTKIIYDQVCYGSYQISDMIDLSTLTITKKLKTEYLSSQSTLSPLSDEVNEQELLKLDLREQKLINKVLKQQQRQKISNMRNHYHVKINNLYTTYRSITDKKQLYIDTLKKQLAKNSNYTTSITSLYFKRKNDYIGLLEDYRQCTKERTYIKEHYPAIYRDPYLNEQQQGEHQENEGSFCLVDDVHHQGWWSVLKEIISHLR